MSTRTPVRNHAHEFTASPNNARRCLCGQLKGHGVHNTEERVSRTIRVGQEIPCTVTCSCGYPRAVGFACTSCSKFDHLPRWHGTKEQLEEGERARAAVPPATTPPTPMPESADESRTAIDDAAKTGVAYVTREWLRARALHGDEDARTYVVKALGDMVLNGRVSLDAALAAAFSLGSRAHWEPNPSREGVKK